MTSEEGKDKKQRLEEFEQELTQLLNKYSQENESNTPDFILAKYLVNCLHAFHRATRVRTHWFKM